MFITTPEDITPKILEFCSQIVSGTTPIYLDVQATPNTKNLECFENVQNHISENGGSVQYGWRIWEWSGVMVEAEFHAVWISPEGDYVDITPADEKKVLFLPDNSKTYEGKTLNNIRFALLNNRFVHEFINVCNQISDIKINSSRALD